MQSYARGVGIHLLAYNIQQATRQTIKNNDAISDYDIFEFLHLRVGGVGGAVK